ncbi:MAG: 16S rRNA (guanine(966)-N(2))-methyltransferase RsmD [Erysipelotrichaceae bacterium]|nr:16S rRNA (guanine(966)-N(2))-methyltransferase RsmD [Erysipelotrichaceae bacterium]
MRIISGKYRNTRLMTLEGDLTRPTKDQVKEAIFSHLFSLKENSFFLDLFGGSGAVGLEAASRGAAVVDIVDSNPKAIRIIRSNIERCKSEECHAYLMDYQSYINGCEKQYDYIFLDPPYEMEGIEELLSSIRKKDLLKSDGLIILETRKGNTFKIEDYEEEDERIYGITKVIYLKEKEND